MKENKLVELSMEFYVDIINLVKFLKANHETIIANQIGRSGTSIGANIHEAQYAQGTKDFISKFEIALKEASETGYWLELLYRTNYIDEQTFKALSSKCTSLRVMLIASCKTAKEKKIVDAFKAGNYQILIVEHIEKDFRKIEIDGAIYDVAIVYDIPNAIAIESDCDFIGKNVSFL